MNVTFTTLAVQVSEALDRYRDAVQRVQDARQRLVKAELAQAAAKEELDKARDVLFEHHPELRPGSQDWHPPEGEFEFVETDDPDDVPEFRETPT